jgi:hypothetical protein
MLAGLHYCGLGFKVLALHRPCVGRIIWCSQARGAIRARHRHSRRHHHRWDRGKRRLPATWRSRANALLKLAESWSRLDARSMRRYQPDRLRPPAALSAGARQRSPCRRPPLRAASRRLCRHVLGRNAHLRARRTHRRAARPARARGARVASVFPADAALGQAGRQYEVINRIRLSRDVFATASHC